MDEIQISKFELLVLELFLKQDKPIELSPKKVDEQFELGIERLIDLFF